MFPVLARVLGNWGPWMCYLIPSMSASSGKFYGDDEGMAHKFERHTEALFHPENKSSWVLHHLNMLRSVFLLFFLHSCLFILINRIAFCFTHVRYYPSPKLDLPRPALSTGSLPVNRQFKILALLELTVLAEESKKSIR